MRRRFQGLVDRCEQQGMALTCNQNTLMNVGPTLPDARNQASLSTFVQKVLHRRQERGFYVHINATIEKEEDIAEEVRPVCAHCQRLIARDGRPPNMSPMKSSQAWSV